MAIKVLRDPHRANCLTKYLAIHDSYMSAWLANGFVIANECPVTYGRDQVFINGTIFCKGGMELEVLKTLNIVRKHLRPKVKTVYFKYNLKVKGLNNVFRYESAVGHRPFPHKHVFDTWGDGEETQFIEYYSPSEVPVLDAVIQEARDWYYENARALASWKR